MAHREGAPQDLTPNILVEQRAHHNANKAQQTGRHIHPPIRQKDGNLPPHSPWMVHLILEDQGDNRKGKEVQIAHALPHTHLNYTIPTSNILVTYGETRKSTYRLLTDTEGTAYTVYTWARYGDLPAPIWNPEPSWHQPLHGRRVPRQGIKPTGGGATGTHGAPPPPHIINSALASASMPLIHTGCPTPDDAAHRRTWGTIRRALHDDINRDQATWIDQGSITIRVGGWLNNLNPKKLRRVAGPYILYPVLHGMDDHCPGLRPGDPPCGHPCPHALFQPLPPQPAPLPGNYLNTVTGAKGVYLTTGDTTGQAIPLDQDVDGEQRGDDGGVGCALLLLRADALHFHDHLHVLNLQEGFLLRESGRTMARRDYPLLGHRNTGARRVPGPLPVDPSRGEPGGAPHGAAGHAWKRGAS